MTRLPFAPSDRAPRWLPWLVVLCAAWVAFVSARKYAGGWNDGSRLATVECLVDHGTWAIDRSVFVAVPPADDPDRPAPYPRQDVGMAAGTRDKLLIGGLYYSDKSPVPALLMAGEYAALKAVTSWTAAARADRFCRVMILASAGLAYVCAVGSVYRLGRPLRLPPGLRVALTASFGLCTIALPYARHVNNHILLLAVAAALLVELAELGRSPTGTPAPRGRLLGVGALAGLAYTIDLGAGPVIACGAAGLVAYRRRLPGLAVFAGVALPWVALHHGLNYAIGGTLGPANARLDYLQWPGSPFTAANSTGGWQHPHVGRFVLYALDLLVGKKGFLGHNLPLYLALFGTAGLLWRRVREAPELLLAAFWCGGVWLLYAAASTNYSGACCSVRWFVPLLAPGYYALAVLLRDFPTYRRDFAVLSGWAAVMALLMWRQGPWMQHVVPLWWLFTAGAVVNWGVVRWWSWRAERRDRAAEVTPEVRRVAA
jgi:hypothetical protein